MNRKQRRLVRRVKRQARRSQATNEEWWAVEAVCRDPLKLDSLQEQIDAARIDPWKNSSRLISMGWRDVFSNLWDWFKTNWPDILKFIITIAPLLLEPKYEDR